MTDLECAVAIRSDVGCVRRRNEDDACYVPGDPPELGSLVVVADGMGGHSGGEVASRYAVETVRATAGSTARDAGDLAQALGEANRAIFEAARHDPKLEGMGTTCTALLVRDGHAYAAHVGDSRLYRVRGDAIEQLTRDHTVVMEMVRRGLLAPEEAKTHENRNVLLRALGPQPEVEIDRGEFRAEPGDRFVLCTDGLHDLLEDEELREITLAHDPEHAAAEMVHLAKERGGFDNVTVALLELRPRG